MFDFIFFGGVFLGNPPPEKINLKIINANEKTISNNHYG